MSYTNLAREYLFLFVELCNYTDVNITLDGLSYYISLVEIMSFFRGENVRSVLNIQLKEAVTEPVTCTSLCLCTRLLQSHLTLHNSIDCSLSGSSVCGIFQARILEWVPMPSSRGSSQPRGWICISCTANRFFTGEALGKPCTSL